MMIAERVKSSREALRYGYYVILGLSLTLSLSKVISFYDFNTFSLKLGPIIDWFSSPLLLFVLFLTTFIRFCHGASLCLVNEPADLRLSVILTDIIFFIFQGIWFYIMASQLIDIKSFLISFTGLILFDLLWIAIKRVFLKCRSKVWLQWVISDLIIIVANILTITIFLYFLHPLLISGFYAVLGVGLFIWDYRSHRAFYSGRWEQDRLTIYIAGPYGDDLPPDVIERNIRDATAAGKEVLLKGHYPFIPHSMFARWETDKRFTVDQFQRSSNYWLGRCGALLYLGPSPGADREKSLAEHMGKTIYTSIAQIPQAD